MPSSTKLHERLKQEVAQRGWSQAEFAEQCDVSRQTVSGWLTGTSLPSAKHRVALADVLGYPQGEFLGEVAQSDTLQRTDYVKNLTWYLREAPVDGARTGGQAAEFAFEHSLRSLAPETTQNSNDEKLDTESSVDLAYTVIELTGDALKDFLDALKFKDLRAHYESIVELRPDLPITGSIRNGLAEIDNGRLTMLRIADEGTTGLIGAEVEDLNFSAVMRDTLSSTKDGSKGGSYGLGKATMWACSQLGLVLANSTLSVPEDGGRSENRLIGRLELPSHTTGDERWDGPGWFGTASDYGASSLWDNAVAAKDLLLARPDGRTGTTFLVVGAHDGAGEATTPEEMAEVIEDELVERFWPAMVEDANGTTRLRVSVGVERNGKREWERRVDPAKRRPFEVSMLSKYYGGEQSDQLDDDGDVVVVRAILQVPKNVGVNPPEPITDHEAVVIVAQVDEREAAAIDTVQYLRGSRMIVETKKVTGLAVGHRPFIALALAGTASDDGPPGNEVAERFLRKAEPPEHNKWTHRTRRVGTDYPGAMTRLRGFHSNVNQAIGAVVNRPIRTQDNGPESLRELLKISDTKPPKAKEPRVTSVSLQSIESDGTWVIEAKLTVPSPQTGLQWLITPVARFGVESGAPYTVGISELTAVRRCSVAEDQVAVDETARTAVIRLRTDPKTHVAPTRYATAGIDIRRSEEVRAS